MTPKRSPKPLSTRRKLGFASVAVLSALLMVELILALTGMQPGLATEDPYVGFVGGLPLFERSTGPGGEVLLATSPRKRSFFNRQEFPLQKADDGYRIFCLGGSTTYGRPYDDRTSFVGWLRAYLAAADPTRAWEVINAGGISYASYRVALLMEELVRYEPDLFIVYTGQNEFLERRTYATLRRSPEWVRQLNLRLGRSRIFTAIQGLVARTRGSSASPPTEGTSLLPAEVKTILDGSVGPRDYVRDDRLREGVVSHYEFNLDRLIDMAHRAGADILFVRPASNIGHCAPFKSEFSEGLSPAQREEWAKWMDRGRRSPSPDEALTAVERALAIDSRRADAHYLHGQVLLAKGDPPRAKRAFERARDEDVCPLRAVAELDSVLQRVCESREVTWVDFVALVESHSPGKIAGQELFLDHVHPTIEGNRILAAELLATLERQGVARPDASWGLEARRAVDSRLLGGIDQRSHAAALRNLSKVLQWAGKGDEAEALAQRALELDPSDAEALLQLGLARQRAGDFDEAEKLMLRAIDLEPGSGRLYGALGSVYLMAGRATDALTALRRAAEIRPDDAIILGNLGIALYENGDPQAALLLYERVHEIDPVDAKSWNNQGSAELALGRFEAAISSFSRAVELVPNYVAAHYGLGVAWGQTRDDEAAIESMRRVLEFESDHVLAHYALGVLYRRVGRPGDATREFEHVLRLDPGHEQARALLGRSREDG